jgi:dTDP-4-dehydrorhamnose reductase
MKVALKGSTGKVGRAWRRLSALESSAVNLSPLGGVAESDLSGADGVKKLVGQIERERPALFVLAAAMTDVDRCEREPAQAEQVNSRAVGEVARACAAAGAGLIFYSTDYVFDGSGPKGEGDLPAPLNVYGRTKLAAEHAIRQTGGDYLIVRINVPLAPEADGKSFYSFVARGLAGGAPVQVVVDQWNNPLDTDRIARWSLAAWARGERGVLHLGGGTYATRFDIARAIAVGLGADPSRVVPVKTAELGQPALRPARGGLLCARQAELFGTAPDLKTILEALLPPTE